jgi:hypothetical protein
MNATTNLIHSQHTQIIQVLNIAMLELTSNRLDAPPKVANGGTTVIMCPILKCIRIVRIEIMKA